MRVILAIAAGGALGAVARHYMTHQVALLAGSGFPWGTLAVNVLGSFIMGLLVEAMALFWSPALELRAFLVVGVLGAFTTFSTFSLETLNLVEEGALARAVANVLLSVVLCIGAAWCGMLAARQL